MIKPDVLLAGQDTKYNTENETLSFSPGRKTFFSKYDPRGSGSNELCCAVIIIHSPAHGSSHQSSDVSRIRLVTLHHQRSYDQLPLLLGRSFRDVKCRRRVQTLRLLTSVFAFVAFCSADIEAANSSGSSSSSSSSKQQQQQQQQCRRRDRDDDEDDIYHRHRSMSSCADDDSLLAAGELRCRGAWL